jgi:hypothetical protein
VLLYGGTFYPRNRRVTDAHNLLERCQTELGDPDAVFRVGAGRVWAKLTLAAGLVLYGVVANYLWWVHGPARFDHLVLIVLIGPPITGLSLFGHLYRTRGLCVLAYPTGLLRLQRGEVESYPWAEVDEVRLKADKGTFVVERDGAGEVTAGWLEVEPPTFQIWNAQLTVRRADGTAAKLTPAVSGYPELVAHVLRETFRAQWPAALARFRAGERVEFGPFEVSRLGLRYEKNLMPWADLAEVNVGSKSLAVKRKGKWLPWVSKELDDVPNPHVLLALIEEARRTARPAGKNKQRPTADDAV